MSFCEEKLCHALFKHGEKKCSQFSVSYARVQQEDVFVKIIIFIFLRRTPHPKEGFTLNEKTKI